MSGERAGAQMPTVLHFDEAKDETLAGRRGDIDEIWAGVFLAVSLAPSQWGEQVPYIIDGNDEPILERDPAVLTCQSTPAVGMRHRQGNQLRGSRPVAGEADGEPTAERLQILQEELGVAAAAAQPHLIERAVDQVANLVEMRGGGDQLEATEVFAFRHAVDDVASYISWLSRGESKYSMPALRSRVTTQSQSRCSFARLSAFSRETSVFNKGDPFPVLRWRATAPSIDLWRRTQHFGVCPAGRMFFALCLGGNGTEPYGRGPARVVSSRKRRAGRRSGRGLEDCICPSLPATTLDSKVSNAMARCAAVSGSCRSLRAHRSRGMFTPPGRLSDFQHPPVFGGQHTSPAAAFLARLGDESPRDAALFRRRVEIKREHRHADRFFFAAILVRCLLVPPVMLVDATERSGHGQAVPGPKRMDMQ